MACDPVGQTEIAARLGVQPNTVNMWRKRELLPPPDWTISGVPAWNWRTILKWAQRTGRAPK